MYKKWDNEKKVILTLICLIISVLAMKSGCLAATTSMIRNGTMEAGSGAVPTYWTASSQTVEKGSSYAHTGALGLRMAKNPGSAAVEQYSGPGAPKPGEEYLLSLWYKSITAQSFTVTYRFINSSNAVVPGSEVIRTISVSEVGDWRSFTEVITAPESAYRFHIKITVANSEIYLDDVTCAEFVPDDPLPASLGSEYVTNGGFENGSAPWSAGNGTISPQNPHSGGYSLRFTAASGSDPLAYTRITNLTGGATYYVSAWVNTTDITGTLHFKTEFYKDNGWTGTSYKGYSTYTENFGITHGAWRRVVRIFEAPPDAQSAVIYLRLFGSGECYFDDVSCFRISEPWKIKLDTNEVFYYSDSAEGAATATLWDSSVGSAVTFTIKNSGGGLVAQDTVNVTDLKAVYEFSPDVLANLKERYTITATAGSYTASSNIYKFNRPEYVGADGRYRISGEEFTPVFSYHVRPEYYDECRDAGINVVQSYAAGDIGTSLNLCESLGIKMLVVLYNDMKPAGHPDNEARTISIVNQYKDHPALFGWALMDEPSVYYQNPGQHLENSYYIVRNLDSKHPAFIVDGSGAIERDSKYCDIFAVDRYPNESNNIAITEDVTAAVEYMDGRKPVYCLLSATSFGDGYYPTGEHLINRVYQAFSSGAKAIGYYVTDSSGFYTSDIFIKLSDFRTRLLEAYDVFLNDRITWSATVNQVYKCSWQDGEDEYLLAVNLLNTGKTAIFAKNQVNYYVVFGGSYSDITVGSSEVTASLQPLQTILIKGDSTPLLVTKNGVPSAVLESGEYTASLSGDGNVVIALYKVLNDKLSLCEIVYPGGNQAQLTPEFSEDEEYIMKVFAWKNYSPLCRNLTIN